MLEASWDGWTALIKDLVNDIICDSEILQDFGLVLRARVRFYIVAITARSNGKDSGLPY